VYKLLICWLDEILTYSYFWKDISEIYEDSLDELRNEFSNRLNTLVKVNEAYEKRLAKLEESSKGS